MQTSSLARPVDLAVRGAVDLRTVETLREEILALALLSPRPELVVDLSAVTFMDVLGAQAFVDAHRLLLQRGRRLRLTGASRAVGRLLAASEGSAGVRLDR